MISSTSEARAKAVNESMFGTMPDDSHHRQRPMNTPLGDHQAAPDTMVLDDGERSDFYLADRHGEDPRSRTDAHR
jgi:hypothetical protein